MGRSEKLLFSLKRRVFPLYCASIVVFSLSPYLLPETATLFSGVAPPPVESSLGEVVSSVYSPDGNRRYRTASARVRYHRTGELTLEPVVMDYYSRATRTMSLKSELGRVLQKGELVRLAGKVELDRPAVAGHARETVRTRDVEIRTGEWTAVTGEQVVIRRGRQLMRGRGMVADLRQGEINLLDNVEVRYGT